MAKRSLTGFYYPLTLAGLCSLGVITLAARRLLGADSTAVLEAILAVLAVFALGMGWVAARKPREIAPSGDPTVDAEIERALQRRASREKERKLP